MRLIQRDRIYIFECNFSEKDIPKKARFYWNSAEAPRVWSTKSKKCASQVAEYADEPLRSELIAFREEFSGALAASKATDAQIEVPANEGLEYLPFQKAGIAYALSRPNVLIGDEMGLGKTIQAIGVINANSDLKKILIVGPASLKINWFKELTKWLVREYVVSIVTAKDGWYVSDYSRPTIMIINYDILTKFHDEVHGQEWDLLVCDECHKMKNPRTIRTREIVGLYDKNLKQIVGRIRAKRNIFLTGTPLLNRPAELWPVANYLAPDAFRSKYWYHKIYCAAAFNGYGYDIKGASNLEGLQEKLRTTFMIRRLKKDVLKELPAKLRQVIEVPANGCASLIAEEQEAFQAHREEIEFLKAAIELAKASEDKADYDAAVAALKQAVRVAFSEMAAVRHRVALAKAPLVIDYLKDAVESHKVVCFAHHKDVIKMIAEEFGNSCVVLTGDTKMEDRDKAVTRFQEDPTCLLFVGSIQAAGVGLTLTAASHVLFAELDWVPANMTQAEDRLHRIGQIANVLVQHLVLEGSLDAEMAHKLVEKQNVIDRALDAETKGLKKIEGTAASYDAASHSLNHDRVGQIANRLDAEKIALIHAAVRKIAGYCDGAVSLDEMGFNRLDASIGKSLAENHSLSPRQAVLGLTMIIKYHRQLGEVVTDALKAILKG